MLSGRRRITTTTDVGRWNAEAVLELLYDRQPRTNSELARDIGLSRSAAERALDLLVAHGVVAKSAPVALASGRPAALYRLRSESGHLLAVDVGAHVVRARVDDLAGPAPGQALADVADDEPAPLQVTPEQSTADRLAALEQLADRALADRGVAPEQVRAVTVATPGIVDGSGVVTACRVIRAADWVGDRLLVRMRERFPYAAVGVDNDANLAVLAEQRFGVVGDAGDVVAVFAGRRVGFGILHDGGLHRGAHHQAGEAANIRDSWWGRAGHWLRRHDAEVRELFASAEAGRPAAVAEVDELARLLGMAFTEVVHTTDPELIVLGGAISLAGPTILDPVAEHFKRACRGTGTPPLLLSALGRRAALLGAAEHARRQAFTHLLDGVQSGRPDTAPRSLP